MFIWTFGPPPNLHAQICSSPYYWLLCSRCVLHEGFFFFFKGMDRQTQFLNVTEDSRHNLCHIPCSSCMIPCRWFLIYLSLSSSLRMKGIMDDQDNMQGFALLLHSCHEITTRNVFCVQTYRSSSVVDFMAAWACLQNAQGPTCHEANPVACTSWL